MNNAITLAPSSTSFLQILKLVKYNWNQFGNVLESVKQRWVFSQCVFAGGHHRLAKRIPFLASENQSNTWACHLSFE